MDERQRVLESVAKNASFKGANLWILACAIVVASVGLNVNSTAVIIGAMLISPLMSPIVSSGFALGTYDFGLLKKSLKNLLIATLVSLCASSIYFLLSPFKDAQSELLARTSPNIYDILIAFFGGLVGAIAVTRVEKGNPIPGVAIATALMPPLCTAGYGLATGNFGFFFGALFLYCINAVFICLATFVITKFLRFPVPEMVDKKQEKMIRTGISLLVIIILIPSVYFAINLYSRQRFEHIVDDFFEKELTSKGYTIVYKSVNYYQTPKKIEIALLRKQFSKNEIDSLNKKINTLNIPVTRLLFRQDTIDRFDMLNKAIRYEISDLKSTISEKNIKIDSLQNIVSKKSIDSKKVLNEARILFPDLDQLSIETHTMHSQKDSTLVTVLLYHSAKIFSIKEKTKFNEWLKERLEVDSIELIQKK
jgi:uncharacterized hydrophobic protein (TIGR00271 family)